MSIEYSVKLPESPEVPFTAIEQTSATYHTASLQFYVHSLRSRSHFLQGFHLDVRLGLVLFVPLSMVAEDVLLLLREDGANVIS